MKKIAKGVLGEARRFQARLSPHVVTRVRMGVLIYTWSGISAIQYCTIVDSTS